MTSSDDDAAARGLSLDERAKRLARWTMSPANNGTISGRALAEGRVTAFILETLQAAQKDDVITVVSEGANFLIKKVGGTAGCPEEGDVLLSFGRVLRFVDTKQGADKLKVVDETKNRQRLAAGSIISTPWGYAHVV
jgi:RNase P/RNase MRP subunit p29